MCRGAVGLQGQVRLIEWGEKHEEASQKKDFYSEPGEKRSFLIVGQMERRAPAIAL